MFFYRRAFNLLTFSQRRLPRTHASCPDAQCLSRSSSRPMFACFFCFFESHADGFTPDSCQTAPPAPCSQQFFFFLFLKLLEGAVISSSAVFVSSTDCEVHILSPVWRSSLCIIVKGNSKSQCKGSDFILFYFIRFVWVFFLSAGCFTVVNTFNLLWLIF